MNNGDSVPVKLAALYSGGKDSTFSVYRTKQKGHEVVCLITLHPIADDSPLFHYPNSWITEYLADAMQIPLIGFTIKGKSKEDEMQGMEQALIQAKKLYGIEGIVYGGISSNYQKKAFEEVCARQNLVPLAPLWNIKPEDYMNELVNSAFDIIIVGVSAMGLGKEWLGKRIDQNSIAQLSTLSKKYGFNLTFEGGEGETLVIDCPIFHRKLRINAVTTHWDGQRGIFEIRDVSLIEK